MQLIYALNGNENADLKKEQRMLIKHSEDIYSLYLVMISLLVEVQKRAEVYIKKAQEKHLATPEEKNPNRKFIQNEVLQSLKANAHLKQELEDYNITNWNLDDEYVDLLFKSLMESELYKDYMSTKTSTYNEDKLFVVDFFKTIIAPNDKLFDYLEDKNITWIDDLPVVNTTIVKMLNKIKPSSSTSLFIPKIFKDEDDKRFAQELLSKTVLNLSVFSEAIDERTKNWDKDRIANIDFVLLQMAICEFQKFPSIPVKVTINEYLEIAKEYSTPKSNIFINGILDKLVKEYEKNGTLNKVGRGLM